MTTRARHLTAIYENGTFRPLEPVDLPERQTVEIIWTEAASPNGFATDPEFQHYCRNVGQVARPIEEVRKALAKIPDSMSEFIRKERDAE
jgi:predicted DNA-binding antitoxin AbrB/MazE fold protein